MIDRARLIPLLVLLAGLPACSGGPATAPVATHRSALSVPPDSSFLPYVCAGSVAGDPVAGDALGDSATGGAQRDLVGDSTYPAFYRAADAENIYFRIRVSGDPRKPGGLTDLQPSSWDVLVDTDGDLGAYEYMLTADGNIGGGTRVQWLQNTIQEPGNPQDPAELLLADLTPAAEHWAVQGTGDGSAFGGDPDYFITLAIPRTLLVDAGLDLGRPFTVWAGTNTRTYSLNSDFACWVGMPPTLDVAASDPGPLDPVGHPDAVPDTALLPSDEPAIIAVLANDTGLEDVPITVTLDTAPAHGTAVVNADGTVTYTPAPGWLGTESFVYRITDADGGSDAAPVTVTVIPPLLDSDGDGIPDLVEDSNRDGKVDPGETDPHDPDTDGDGILDGVGVRGGGCASGPGGAASLLLLGAAAWLRRRRASR